MKRKRLVGWIAFVALFALFPVVLACARPSHTTPNARALSSLRNGSYVNGTHGFRIQRRSDGRLIATDWRITSHFEGDDGRMRLRRDLVVDVDYDSTGDGVFDRRGSLDVLSLRFEHRATASRIWLAAMPLNSGEGELDLAILAQRYVERAASSGSIFVPHRFGVASVERRVAYRIVRSSPTVLDGSQAHEIVFELADVDQLGAGGTTRWRRAAVILGRTAFAWRPRANSDDAFPVVMVLGYRAEPGVYDRDESAFRELLPRFDFGPAHDAMVQHAGVVGACFGAAGEQVHGHQLVNMRMRRGEVVANFPSPAIRRSATHTEALLTFGGCVAATLNLTPDDIMRSELGIPFLARESWVHGAFFTPFETASEPTPEAVASDAVADPWATE